MTWPRMALLLALLMTCALHLQADAIPASQPDDSRLRVNGGTQLLGPDTAVGLDFMFQADSSGGGTFTFTNASGETWFDLEILVPMPNQISAILCGGDTFAYCSVEPGRNGYYAELIFWGGHGVLAGKDFTIELAGWTPNGTFAAFANTPEPSTIVLLLTACTPAFLRARRARIPR